MKKKLLLNKQTITALNDKSQLNIKGGTQVSEIQCYTENWCDTNHDGSCQCQGVYTVETCACATNTCTNVYSQCCL